MESGWDPNPVGRGRGHELCAAQAVRMEQMRCGRKMEREAGSKTHPSGETAVTLHKGPLRKLKFRKQKSDSEKMPENSTRLGAAPEPARSQPGRCGRATRPAGSSPSTSCIQTARLRVPASSTRDQGDEQGGGETPGAAAGLRSHPEKAAACSLPAPGTQDDLLGPHMLPPCVTAPGDWDEKHPEDAGDAQRRCGGCSPCSAGSLPKELHPAAFRACSAQGAAGELGAMKRKMKQSEINPACWMESVRALEKQRKL